MNIEAVIEQWEADEARVRARLIDPGTALPAQVAGRTGLQVFEAIFAGELPPPPMGETLDFVPIHIAPGEAVFQGRPRHRHYNPLGTVHGGWFATLLDTAVGCAVHAGRQVATAEGRIVGPDGKLYAHATTTCLIFDERAPG